eukprot:TCONS_00011938-protein
MNINATDVCDIGTSDCDPNRSMCVMNDDEDSDFYSCSCSNGYLSNSTTQCLDYCEKGVDDCDKTSTNCTATPGILPHYKCECKLGYNRKDNTTCVLPPTGEPTTGTTDDDDIIIIVVVVCSLTLFFLLILAIFLRYQRDRDDEVGQDIGGGAASSYRIKNPNESPNPGMYRKSVKYDDIDIGHGGPSAGGSRQELGDIPDY